MPRILSPAITDTGVGGCGRVHSQSRPLPTRRRRKCRQPTSTACQPRTTARGAVGGPDLAMVTSALAGLATVEWLSSDEADSRNPVSLALLTVTRK